MGKCCQVVAYDHSESVFFFQMDVAVKTVRVDAMGHGEQEFMREARIMVTLNHPCIVKLIGATQSKPLMLVSFNAVRVLINAHPTNLVGTGIGSYGRSDRLPI